MIKKIFPVFLLLLLIIINFSVSAESSSVKWFTEYGAALKAAETERKNIFVLITAPSWCVWCVRLEENVLSKTSFQKYLSENYIPLKLLDKINGRRNPELENFDIRGFPSIFLYDYNGNYIENIYTQDPDIMVESLVRNISAKGINRPLLKDLKLPEKYLFSYNGGGEYINNNDKTWTEKSSGKEVLYRQKSYDYQYLYLEHPAESILIALPMAGTVSHIATKVDGSWVWNKLGSIRRIGGDDFFIKAE